MRTLVAVPAAGTSIRVLGGFAVTVDDRPVAVPTNARRLLGFLAVTRTEQRRDTAATHLWPWTSAERAMSNLRTALWRVRQADRSIVTAGRDSVRLAEGVQVDYHLLTAQARVMLDASRPDDDLPRIQPDLLEAELLPGWDEEWLLFDRERHRQLRIHALESMSVALAGQGAFARAVDVACAAIRIEPLHEAAHAALIHAHIAEGNRTEAIRHFKAYTRLLADEAGLTPSPRLAELLDPLTGNIA